MEVKGIFGSIKDNGKFESKSKSMIALNNGEGVQLGTVVAKKNNISLPIILQEIGCVVVDENKKFLGMLGVCRYNNRVVYQYITKEKADEIGLKVNFLLEPYVVKIKKGGQGGRGESMSLITYVVLKDNIRGNKLLREYDYIRNSSLVDVMSVSYQNSTVKLGWICEICGKKFESLLNNRIGHTQSDCDCFKPFYKTSTNEELVVLMLKKSLPNIQVQVPVFGDRRRADMAFETEAGKFIIEYDGIFHDRDKDYERDLEAKALGYTTIRIVEIARNCFNINNLDIIDKERGAYIPELDRHTVVCNYFKYNGDTEGTLNNMFQSLQEILDINGVKIKIEKVTSEMIEQAKINRKVNKRKIEAC